MSPLTINLSRKKEKADTAFYFNFSENKFWGALTLDSILPLVLRRRFSKVLTIIIIAAIIPYILLAGFSLVNFLSSRLVIGPLDVVVSRSNVPLSSYQDFWTGVLFISLALRLLILALDGFYNSKTLKKNGDSPNDNFAKRLNFYASELCFKSSLFRTLSIPDLLAGISKTSLGSTLILRLGIQDAEYDAFLKINAASEDKSPDKLFDYFQNKLNPDEDITFARIFVALFDIHKQFYTFLVEKGYRRDIVKGAAEWIEKEFIDADLERRWWRREKLARIPGFGKDWAYGRTPLLERFTSDLSLAARAADMRLIGKEREVELLESALLKQSGANVVIVGEPGSGKEAVLLGLTRMIILGKIFPELEHWQVLKLQSAMIAAEGKDKGNTEELLLRALNEAVRAGNIILAIDEFPEFVESLDKLGVNVNEVFSPYFASDSIHIIALSDTQGFRRVLENNAGLMKYFEKIEIAEPNEKNITEILESLVPAMEAANNYKTVITYSALEKTSYSAINNLVTGFLPERAVDLLEQVIGDVASRGSPFVLPEDVERFVSEKTKMPLGEIKAEEQEKLLGLEKLLHARVIGQDEAINSIADAVRRARSGIRNPKRPIGSFLFLGPTGVGKTETAKALAEVYFGNEDAMIRFDMTEFQSDEDLKRLIGSQETKSPGLLSSKIRSNPYSVVLLDEFEKSSRGIRNLFLQILDEGFFSDFLGQKINMRNTLIVATSNAGSSMIFEAAKKSLDPSKMKDELINYIQKEKIMSPELLNRFDSVVVFHPLNIEVLKKIARIMLEKLVKRLKQQNLTLSITDDIVNFAAEGGYDPAFGARPMQRFIQDKIEKAISEKIIRGEIKPGSEFSLSTNDLK